MSSNVHDQSTIGLSDCSHGLPVIQSMGSQSQVPTQVNPSSRGILSPPPMMASAPWSVSDPGNHCLRLSEKLRVQREQARFADLILSVQGREFPAHRCVLAACSTWFDSKLKVHKCTREHIEIDQCKDYEIFYALLTYCYTGHIVINDANVSELLHLSHYYGMTKMKSYCCDYLHRHLSVKTVHSALDQAIKYQLTDLSKQAISFLHRHFSYLLHNQKDELLSYSYNIVQGFLMEKAWSLPQELVVKFIASWISADTSSREDFFVNLLDFVDWSAINTEYILHHLDTEPLYNNSDALYTILHILDRNGKYFGPKFQEIYQNLQDAQELDELNDSNSFLSMAINSVVKDLEHSEVDPDWFLQTESHQLPPESMMTSSGTNIVMPQASTLSQRQERLERYKDSFDLDIVEQVINEQQQLTDDRNKFVASKRYDPKFRALTEASRLKGEEVDGEIPSPSPKMSHYPMHPKQRHLSSTLAYTNHTSRNDIVNVRGSHIQVDYLPNQRTMVSDSDVPFEASSLMVDYDFIVPDVNDSMVDSHMSRGGHQVHFEERHFQHNAVPLSNSPNILQHNDHIQSSKPCLEHRLQLQSQMESQMSHNQAMDNQLEHLQRHQQIDSHINRQQSEQPMQRHQQLEQHLHLQESDQNLLRHKTNQQLERQQTEQLLLRQQADQQIESQQQLQRHQTVEQLDRQQAEKHLPRLELSQHLIRHQTGQQLDRQHLPEHLLRQQVDQQIENLQRHSMIEQVDRKHFEKHLPRQESNQNLLRHQTNQQLDRQQTEQLLLRQQADQQIESQQQLQRHQTVEQLDRQLQKHLPRQELSQHLIRHHTNQQMDRQQTMQQLHRQEPEQEFGQQLLRHQSEHQLHKQHLLKPDPDQQMLRQESDLYLLRKQPEEQLHRQQGGHQFLRQPMDEQLHSSLSSQEPNRQIDQQLPIQQTDEELEARQQVSDYQQLVDKGPDLDEDEEDMSREENNLLVEYEEPIKEESSKESRNVVNPTSEGSPNEQVKPEQTFDFDEEVYAVEGKKQKASKLQRLSSLQDTSDTQQSLPCDPPNPNRHIKKAKLLAEHRNSETSLAKVQSLDKTKVKSKQLLSCSLCSYTTRFKPCLAAHEKRHENSNPSPPVQCPFCSQQFDWKSDLRSHVQKHHSGPPYVCQTCQYLTPKLSTLLTHCQTHRSEKMLKCDEANCDYTTNTIHRLKFHKKTKHQASTFKCEECGKSFNAKQTLVTHQLVHKKDDVKLFSCRDCNFSTKYSNHFSLHKKIHSGQVFRCSVVANCTYSTPKMSHLVSHQRTHLGEKLFTCDVCQKGFVEKSQMIRHSKIHTSEMPFTCKKCKFKTKRKDKLKNHMLKIHGESQM